MLTPVFWSLAWRRDEASGAAEVGELRRALQAGDAIYATGLILQELLQGFRGPKAHKQIIDRFSTVPLLVPDREDHIRAAALCNLCRGRGIQVGTIDALLAHLCVRHDLLLLTTDKDFDQIGKAAPLVLWKP